MTNIMKKTLLTISLFIGMAAGAIAQTPEASNPPVQNAATPKVEIAGHPESIGVRVGTMGIDISYNHALDFTQFIQTDLGLDFGYNTSGTPGIKATALYNYTWAHPAWTESGRWALYAGAGFTVGYVEDAVPYSIAEKLITGIYDSGLMLAVALQAGLSYKFDFPLQLAIDIRPYFGMHRNDGKVRIGDIEYNYGEKTGFYDNGLMGFIPTVSVRYMF